MINYTYEIGRELKDKKRDIIIIDRKYEQDNSGDKKQKYKYLCKKCGFDCSTRFFRDGEYHDEYWIYGSHLKKGTGCSCCQGRVVVKGINDFATFYQDYIKYFDNKEDAFTHSCGSIKKVDIHCPVCGKIRKYKIKDYVNHMNEGQFICYNCSDKMPMGEKILYTLFTYLEIGFVKEATKNTFSWLNTNIRYDFYLKDYNMIIENMGSQHTDNQGFSNVGGKTLIEEQKNDKMKYELAIANGINPEDYVYIDASKSDYDYIISSIKESQLSKIFDFTKVDWNYIKLKSMKTIMIDIAEYWNNNPSATTKTLSEVFHFSRPCVTNYIKQAANIGLCKYDEEEYNIKRRPNIYINDTVDTATPIKCNETNSYFKSYGLCARVSEKEFGIKLNNSSIKSVLDKKYSQHRGYTFSYVTKKDFNKAIENGLTVYGSHFKNV